MFLLLVLSAFMIKGVELNNHNDTESSRTFFPLVFPDGGLISAVFGLLVPMDIRSWQTIVCLQNLRAQYSVPPNFASEYSVFTSKTLEAKPDSTRTMAYHIIEAVLDKTGINGMPCILRTICETAQMPLNHYGNGLLGDVLHLFFTPGKHEILDELYSDAMVAGRKGADCMTLYKKCPFGHGILDSISAFL